MKVFNNLLNIGLAVCLAAFLTGTAAAAGLSFDAPSRGLSLSAVSYPDITASSPPRLSVVPAVQGARVYDFKTLYASLGYPSPDYFGSSEEEVMDLESYTSKQDTFYKEINDYLRYYPKPYDWYGTSPEAAKGIVKNMDRIFDRAPALPADLLLFRGLGLKYHGNKPYAAGEEFTDKGFVSTSVSYKVARYFAVEIGGDDTAADRKAIFAIYLGRPGEKGVLVDQNEDEVILKHGTKFRVMAQNNGVKKYDLYLVQACADFCEPVLKKDVAAFWAAFNVQD